MKIGLRILPILLRLLLVGVIALAVYPIGYGITRRMTVVGMLVLWLGVLVSARNRRGWFNGLLAMGLIPALFLLLPGRKPDTELLRTSYLNHLRRYEGTKYVWGGENILGIDCSGLVRQGWINANLDTGLRTFNPALVRSAVSMTWHDCSAMALRDEYRGYARRIGPLQSINRADPAAIRPGTIAVTRNGIHVLAYIGNSQWIQADPGAGRVTVHSVPDEQGWFESPVVLLAWQALDD